VDEQLEDNTFIPYLTKEVLKQLSEYNDDIKVEASLGIRIILNEFLPSSVVADTNKPALQTMRANSMIGLTSEMEKQLKQLFGAEIQSVNYLFGSKDGDVPLVPDVFRKIITYYIDEQGASN
jgi:hypothetical protein